MNLKNFDTVTRYDFMDTIMKYAQTLPFDVERVAESIGKHVYDEDINAYITDIVHQYRQGEIVIEIEVWNHLFDHIGEEFPAIIADYYNLDFPRKLASRGRITKLVIGKQICTSRKNTI